MQLPNQALQKVEAQRLSKAVEGYTKGDYTIRVTRNTEESVEGFVKNGDGIEYAVSLTPHRVFCSCKDSMFRHTVCKHATVLALYVIRNPQLKEKKEARPYNLNLVKTRKGFASA